MEIIKVYSPIEDKDIRKNLNGSPIWTKSYHADEVDAVMSKNNNMFEYTIKFDGTKPVMVNNVKRYTK